MKTKQTIAIVGATGKMGAALAKSLAKSSYRLLLMGTDEVKLQSLYEQVQKIHKEVDADWILCPIDASWEADIIVLAVPYTAEKELARKIKAVSTGKIVISISNPITPDFQGSLLSEHDSAAEELQALLPHSKVVKAFNTTFAANFGQPIFSGQRADCFLAGNDEEALKQTQALVQEVGFKPVIAGNLATRRTLENMQILLMQLGIKNHYNWRAGWKILHD
ncbi:NAD(P)-binding domain-containing protein [Olivibacter sp. CPCC 100613]|uniref:NADPH-dependent F420 reductase n=1 Tax=Olivibacter sp. CPCC 100613 TaxID=3079931 RepID=UPI002FF63203